MNAGMARIGFLGLGAMGSRMAARLLAAGHDLTVWNRSPDAAARLTRSGARMAKTPRAAAMRQDFVFSMLRDDTAAAGVWLGDDGALSGMAPDAVGVECSTLSLPGVRHLAQAFATAGRDLVEAPLAGSRPQAEAGSLIFLAGGEAGPIDRLRPVLLAMGSALHHAGPCGAGCLAKLHVNAMFGAGLAVTAEFIGLIRKAGLDPAPILAAWAETPVAAPALKLAAPGMLGDSFPPAFPIDLVAKDFAMMQRSATGAGAAMPVTKELGQIFAAARDEGLGDLNATGIVRRYTI